MTLTADLIWHIIPSVKGKRVIGYDNAEGQGDHRHYRDEIEPYTFKDLNTLAEDFYEDMERFKEGKL